MNEFQKFLNRNQGSITKALLVEFQSSHNDKAGGAIKQAIDRLDRAVVLRITPVNGQITVVSVPKTRQDRQRMTAANGSQALDLTFSSVSGMIDVLIALERAFDPTVTGAFEIPEERTPKADGRYSFATAKFVSDHVASYTANGPALIAADALKVAKRRMILNGAFTNISVSSTMVLKNKHQSLQAEINDRQSEFEKIYKYLTASNTRFAILLQGEHEEIIFTTRQKYDFYEGTRRALATDDPLITALGDNYLRYSVQKVGDKWLLHHMAGRAGANSRDVIPSNAYLAFDYANIAGGKGKAVTADTATFCKIS